MNDNLIKLYYRGDEMKLFKTLGAVALITVLLATGCAPKTEGSQDQNNDGSDNGSSVVVKEDNQAKENEEAVSLDSAELIDQNIEKLTIESFVLPAEREGWEGRTVERYKDGEKLVKLVVAVHNDSGQMSGRMSFYFVEEQLVQVSDPFNLYSYADGAIEQIVDERGNEVEFSDENKLERAENHLEMANRYSEIVKNFGYDIVDGEFKDEARNISIKYPVITNYGGELIQDYMNQSLEKIYKTFRNESYKDVQIDYIITYRDENYLSVIYTGKAVNEGMGKEITVLKSMNLDIGKSSNEINFANFVKDEAGLKTVLEAYSGDSLEYEGMRLYFDGPYVTFFYMPLDDTADTFMKISVPRDELAPFVNWDFGEMPAS